MMTACRREILAALGVAALTFAGATTVMAVAVPPASGIDPDLLERGKLQPVDAASSRELRRLPDKDSDDDDDDDDDEQA